MVGVDSHAHSVCQVAGGLTIGVLGFGFEHSYPQHHAHFLDELVRNGGVLISEYPPWMKPNKGQFVQRNRLVAGLSKIIVVTEAAAKSGTKITVDFGLDAGRDVCAVPGPITSPYSQGTKAIINEGGRLVTSGYEVLSIAGWDMQPLSPRTAGLKAALLAQIAAGPASIQELVVALKQEIPVVLELVTTLELSGEIKQERGRWYPIVYNGSVRHQKQEAL
jgi:DNA processing protein